MPATGWQRRRVDHVRAAPGETSEEAGETGWTGES